MDRYDNCHERMKKPHKFHAKVGHEQFSVVRQCASLSIARSGLCYERTGELAIYLALNAGN